MARKSSAQDRAQRGLKELVERYRGRGLHILPSCSELARSLDVSVPTVSKVCNRLADEGQLVVRQGARTRIRGIGGEPGAAPELSQPEAYTYERVAESIRERMYRGEWSAGAELPPQKVFCEEYRVSRPTVAKAFRHLEQKGVIERRYGKFGVVRPEKPSRSAKIVFVVRRQAGGTVVPSPVGTRMHEQLEAACNSLGIGVLNTLAFYRTPDTLGYSFDWTRAGSLKESRYPVLGFIVHYMAVQRNCRFIADLARHRLPVAVLYTDSTPPYHVSATVAPIASIRPAADSAAGAKVARHLWAGGHTRVAYLTAHADKPWSQQRFDSLRNELNRLSSSRARVDLIGADEKRREPRRTLSERVGAEARRFVNESHSRKPALPSLSRRWMHEQAWPHISNLEHLRRTHGSFFESSCKLVERALELGDLTAVVCADDFMATVCQEYCWWKKIRVPHHIAIYSFDDSPSALRLGITSFNFGITELTHRAVSHILYPPAPSRPGHWAPRELTMEGFLSVRESTM